MPNVRHKLAHPKGGL
jgi:hypothetical protein